jgi:hypothetical protein
MNFYIITDKELLAPFPASPNQPGFAPYRNIQDYVDQALGSLILRRKVFHLASAAIRYGCGLEFPYPGHYTTVRAEQNLWRDLVEQAGTDFYGRVNPHMPNENAWSMFDEGELTFDWATSLAETKASQLARAYLDFVIDGDAFGERSNEALNRVKNSRLFEALMACTQPPFAPPDSIFRLEQYPFVDLSVRGRRDVIITGRLT